MVSGKLSMRGIFGTLPGLDEFQEARPLPGLGVFGPDHIATGKLAIPVTFVRGTEKFAPQRATAVSAVS